MAQRANHQQDQRDVGIGDGADDPLPQRQLVDFDRGARGVQRLRAAVEARDRAAIERRQQLLLVGRDQIDQVLVERLAFGERFALRARRSRPARCCARV